MSKRDTTWVVLPQEEVIVMFKKALPKYANRLYPERAWLWLAKDEVPVTVAKTLRKMGFFHAPRGRNTEGGMAHWAHHCDRPVQFRGRSAPRTKVPDVAPEPETEPETEHENQDPFGEFERLFGNE